MRLIGNVIKGILAIAMIVAVAGAGVVLFLALSPVFSAPASSSENAEPVMFVVQPGETVDDVAENLKEQKIIDNTFWFKLKMRMADDSQSIKAGRFQLTPGMDLDELIKTLSTPPAEIGIRFTVIEGNRIEEMAEKLSASGIISAENFLRLAGTPEGAATFANDFLNSSGRPEGHGLEGYLFPDTYEIKQSGGDNSEAVIKVMLETMAEKFTPEMRQVLDSRAISIHEVLTIASIVQREGVVKEELRDIASVFWNRVAQGMALGADPTTQYGAGKSPNWWPNLDEIGVKPGEFNHPYNTYVIPGLPPGPICNPGLAAIEAAVYPSDTPYLYFVAKNDGTGEHAFAETLEEHERNRVLYGNR